MAEQGPANATWRVVNRDLAWTELPVPPPPDEPPGGADRALFEFAFNRILLVRYKSDSDIGQELNRDLFGTVRRAIPEFALPERYRGIEVRTNAHLPTNPARRSRLIAVNDEDETITVVDHKQHQD
jgi:hypothetical protein